MQAILMSGRRHKKLNLLIEFWNSIFIKRHFKAYENKLDSNLHLIYISLPGFFCFNLFIWLPDVKGPNFFSFAPLPSTNVPPYTHAGVDRASRPPSEICDLFIRNDSILNLLSKSDISKTAWINPRYNRSSNSKDKLKKNHCSSYGARLVHQLLAPRAGSYEHGRTLCFSPSKNNMRLTYK